MNRYNGHILVADDDKRLRLLLKKYLEGEGFMVSSAEDSDIALNLFLRDNTIDLMILDVMMPGKNGVELTREVKSKRDMPILLLTAMAEVEDRISGLESGADDYLTKPFEPRELCLRIKNLLQRKDRNIESKKWVCFGTYRLNMSTEDLYRGNDLVNLTSTENILLLMLANNLNSPVSREAISVQLNNISERSIDVQITRLRRKLGGESNNTDFIKTVRGKGYVLKGQKHS